MPRIIGFYFGTRLKQDFDPDIFRRGVRSHTIVLGNFFLVVWGFGVIENLVKGNRFVLSPSGDNSLLTRNLSVFFGINSIEVESDWLGSIPVFYNLSNYSVSTLSLLCSHDEFSIDEEGLACYLKYGYSAFESTVFTNVKFLRYCSRLVVNEVGIKAIYLKDPVLQESFLNDECDEKDSISIVSKVVNELVELNSAKVVIPTSGGYDSRFLNYLLKNRSRIESFTYGISNEQALSFEAVYAGRLSKILGTSWSQVFLGNFWSLREDWFNLYGYSTHLHGMYQIDFYQQICKNLGDKTDSILLSGIVGDVWAGSVSNLTIGGVNDVYKLFYSHGMSIDSEYISVKNSSLEDAFWRKNKELLQNHRYATVMLVRTKMILLSYLMEVPTYMGFIAVSPFLDYKVVKSMLSIPEHRRFSRKWQSDFFNFANLNLEDMGLKFKVDNSLNYCQVLQNNFEELDVESFKGIVDLNRVKWINQKLKSIGLMDRFHQYILISWPLLGKVLHKIGLRSRVTIAYNEYCVLHNIGRLTNNMK